MRRLIFALLGIASTLSPCLAEVKPVRVITWNLEWFPGKKPAASTAEQETHFAEVAAILPGLGADVLVLQEVRDEATAEKLAALMPGFRAHVTSRFKDAVGGAVGLQQVAILSRFPAEAAWAEAWKKGWAGAPRGYAYARLNVGGRPLHVYGLHLKSNLGDAATNTSKREDAMEQLLAHIETQTRPADAVVVCGDFNTSKDLPGFAGDSTLRKIEGAGFFWTFEGVPVALRITIPGGGRYPDACFDHIYVRRLGRPVATVLTDTPGSDHLPVVVDLGL